jgi:hypothetical protein
MKCFGLGQILWHIIFSINIRPRFKPNTLYMAVFFRWTGRRCIPITVATLNLNNGFGSSVNAVRDPAHAQLLLFVTQLRKHVFK